MLATRRCGTAGARGRAWALVRAGCRSGGSLISHSERASAAFESWQHEGTRRRTASRPQPFARASRARSRLGCVPGRGSPGPGTAAAAVAHEAGRRLLVLVPSRTAFELIPCARVRATASYFRALATPAGLVDPLAPGSSRRSRRLTERRDDALPAAPDRARQERYRDPARGQAARPDGRGVSRLWHRVTLPIAAIRAWSGTGIPQSGRSAAPHGRLNATSRPVPPARSPP